LSDAVILRGYTVFVKNYFSDLAILWNLISKQIQRYMEIFFFWNEIPMNSQPALWEQ